MKYMKIRNLKALEMWMVKEYPKGVIFKAYAKVGSEFAFSEEDSAFKCLKGLSKEINKLTK